MSTDPPILCRCTPGDDAHALGFRPTCPSEDDARAALTGPYAAAPPYQRLQTWNNMTETPPAPMSESGKPTNIAPTDETRRWPDSIARHQHRTFTAPTDDVAALVARLRLPFVTDSAHREAANVLERHAAALQAVEALCAEWANEGDVPAENLAYEITAAIARELNREEHSDA